MKKVKYENVSKLFYGINNNFNKLGFPPFSCQVQNLIPVQVICDIISHPFFFLFLILFSF